VLRSRIAIIALASMATMAPMRPIRAGVLYIYQSSVLHDGSGETDQFVVTFTSPFTLAPSSYYNISVSAGQNAITGWGASDARLGDNLNGSTAPISLVPAPGLMASTPLSRVALVGCDPNPFLSCLGGTIGTNAAGQIDQWNLIATGAVLTNGSYSTFITYNNPYLGSVDEFVFDNGQDVFSVSGQNGSWNGFTATTYPPPLSSPPGPPSIPEPSTWAMMLLGFAGLAYAGRRTPRKSAVI
jgi:hypothetical protein